jgi:hypothetical protein
LEREGQKKDEEGRVWWKKMKEEEEEGEGVKREKEIRKQEKCRIKDTKEKDLANK